MADIDLQLDQIVSEKGTFFNFFRTPIGMVLKIQNISSQNVVITDVIMNLIDGKTKFTSTVPLQYAQTLIAPKQVKSTDDYLYHINNYAKGTMFNITINYHIGGYSNPSVFHSNYYPLGKFKKL